MPIPSVSFRNTQTFFPREIFKNWQAFFKAEYDQSKISKREDNPPTASELENDKFLLTLRALAALAYEKVSDQDNVIFDKNDFIELIVELLNNRNGVGSDYAQAMAYSICQVLNLKEINEIYNRIHDLYINNNKQNVALIYKSTDATLAFILELKNQGLRHEDKLNEFARAQTYGLFDKVFTIIAADFSYYRHLSERLDHLIENENNIDVLKEQFNQLLTWYLNNGCYYDPATLKLMAIFKHALDNSANDQLPKMIADFTKLVSGKDKTLNLTIEMLTDLSLKNIKEMLTIWRKKFPVYQISLSAADNLIKVGKMYNGALVSISSKPAQTLPLLLRAQNAVSADALKAAFPANEASKDRNIELIVIKDDPNANPKQYNHFELGMQMGEMNFRGFQVHMENYQNEKYPRLEKEADELKEVNFKQRQESFNASYDADLICMEILELINNPEFVKIITPELAAQLGGMAGTALKLLQEAIVLQGTDVKSAQEGEELKNKLIKIMTERMPIIMQLKQILIKLVVPKTDGSREIMEALSLLPNFSSSILCGFLRLNYYPLWSKDNNNSTQFRGSISSGLSKTLKEPVLDLARLHFMEKNTSPLSLKDNNLALKKVKQTLYDEVYELEMQKQVISKLYLKFSTFDPATESEQLEQMNSAVKKLTKKQKENVRKANELMQPLGLKLLQTSWKEVQKQFPQKKDFSNLEAGLELRLVEHLIILLNQTIISGEKKLFGEIFEFAKKHRYMPGSSLWNQATIKNPSPVLAAVYYEQLEYLERLFSEASESVRFELVNLKLSVGAEQFSCLAIAAAQGSTQMTSFLLKNGANIIEKNGTQNKTALVIAAEDGKIPQVKLLLKHYFHLMGKKSEQQNDLRKSLQEDLNYIQQFVTNQKLQKLVLEALAKIEPKPAQLERKDSKSKITENKSSSHKGSAEGKVGVSKKVQLFEKMKTSSSSVNINIQPELETIAQGKGKIQLVKLLIKSNHEALQEFFIKQVKAKITRRTGKLSFYSKDHITPMLTEIAAYFEKNDSTVYKNLITSIADVYDEQNKKSIEFLGKISKEFAVAVKQEYENSSYERDSESEDSYESPLLS